MQKKSLFWLIWLIALPAITFWIFLAQGTNVHPLKAIPPYLNEVSIFPLNQMDKSPDLPQQNQPQAKDLKILKQAVAHWVDTDLSFDSISYYVFDRTRPGSVSTLTAIRLLSDKKDLELWTGFIPPGQKSEHIYRRTPILHYESEEQPACFWAIAKGVLLISFDQKLVERSIALLDEKAPSLYVYLKRRQLLNSKSPVQVLFNLGRTTDPLWSRLDWYSLEARDSLNGTVLLTADDFQNKLYRQKAVDFSPLLMVLPDRIQLADMISTEQAGVYFRERKALGPQFWTFSLQSLLGGQVAYVLEEAGQGLNASFLIASLQDAERARGVLQDVTDQNGLLEQFSYQAHPIIRTLAEDVSSPFYGDRYPDIKNPYWTIMEGFLVCSSDPDRLKLWMDFLVLQKNLAQSKAMEPFFPMLQQKSYRSVLWQAPFPGNLWKENEDWWPGWTNSHPRGLISWDKKGANWEVTGKLRSVASSEAMVELSWRKDLFKAIIYGPKVLRDPLTGNIHGLLVQDRDHQLHLFGPEGTFLWEIELDGPVQGNVQSFQINPIEWGIIFNTQHSIYKLDAQGQMLATWPMQVPAAQGLRLMVFGESGDPHFFLPSNKQGVYGYNIWGDALMRWNPCPLDYDFRSPIFHMASQSKDHLFWLDQQGRLRAKYRDGADADMDLLSQKIVSLFFSEKNGLTYVLGEAGSIGRLNSDLEYRELAKSVRSVSAFQWMEKEGALFLIKKDEKGIQRWKLEEASALRQLNMAYPAGNHRLGLIRAGDTFWTVLQDMDRQRLQILDDQGKPLFSEFIPCDGEFSLYERFDHHFLTTSLDGELMVYRLPITN